MNASYACTDFRESSWTRRHLLKIGGMGMLGLNLPGLLKAEAERDTQNRPLPIAAGDPVMDLIG